jgi:hypothetical protein
MVQGCKISGNKKKSTEVDFNPNSGKINREVFEADCGSPGAFGLVL